MTLCRRSRIKLPDWAWSPAGLWVSGSRCAFVHRPAGWLVSRSGDTSAEVARPDTRETCLVPVYVCCHLRQRVNVGIGSRESRHPMEISSRDGGQERSGHEGRTNRGWHTSTCNFDAPNTELGFTAREETKCEKNCSEFAVLMPFSRFNIFQRGR